MQSIVSFLLYWILKIGLSLRYRIEVRGLNEALQEAQARFPGRPEMLILPNHVAEIDPVILMIVLWPNFRPRPVVVEDFFYQQGLRIFMESVAALPCPNMETTVNRWKIKQLKKLQQIIIDGLHTGDKFLIYPSGKLKLSSREVLGGASFVPGILVDVPNLPVLMVRSTGPWGSRFSRAITGKVPSFSGVVFQGIKTGIKNLIFFTPRREVLIECQLAPAEFYNQKDRQQINRFLEGWYNSAQQGEGDQLTLVPYSIWNNVLPKITAEEEKVETVDISLLSQENRTEIVGKVAELANIAVNTVQQDQELLRDLGLDSLDIAQLTVYLDERFHVKDLSPADLTKVSDLFAIVIKQAGKEGLSKPVAQEALPLPGKEKHRPAPISPEGKTIHEAFLRSCDRMGNAVACIDATSGILSYRRLKLGALILSEKIRKLPGEHIGVLFPSSVGAYLVILAIQLAGKTPVMLNWTAGVKALDHAANIMKLETVISSIKFLTRLKDLEIGIIEDRVVLVEDLRREVTLKDKLKGMWSSYKSADTLLKKLALDQEKAEDTAVVLFTSGTETLPKAVPLTHDNILSNQKSAIKCVDYNERDILYAVLPPFHSFGFSVTGLLPILSGLKVVYAPDPTDGHAMAREIAAYGITLFCCAPSFIQGLFHVAGPGQLKTLRLIVAGAEKTPELLFEEVRKLGTDAQLLEGYGITECSPIVTLCRPNEKKAGVGRPIGGVEICAIDPESGRLLPQGEQGEICIHGPNVFKGYLDVDRNPFLELSGKKWYRSGDLGIIGADGSLSLTGRLKRFVKIGGEMVSLGGLEEELLDIIKQAQAGQNSVDLAALKGPPLALCALEKEGGKTQLVLFTIYNIERDPLNIALKRRGYSNLVRLSEVKNLQEIPLTGTGKTHYRFLEQSLL